jgi:folate-dependent phosphoribosylglycinamide formyltransferase PurN
VLVISNHPDHEEAVRSFGLPYHHLVVTHESRPDAERAALELMRGQIDLLVLARYMQILSGEFLQSLGCPAINIHHSFLPAFAGADPYQRAWERGVKLIGATAHYVTEDLDAGPIIEQDTGRVSHRDEVGDLVRIGRDLERLVLARAVRAHLEDRVLVTAGLAGFCMIFLYEWTHFLIHTAYRPRSAAYKAIWKNHRLHHFKNEHFWHGVTNNLSDRVLGTNPDQREVAKSETARMLAAE